MCLTHTYCDIQKKVHLSLFLWSVKIRQQRFEMIHYKLAREKSMVSKIYDNMLSFQTRCNFTTQEK